MSTLIKNGTIVTASDTFIGDIRLSKERIQEIAISLTAEPEEMVIEAQGLLVFPGGIDIHTHFDHVGMTDDFADGSRAALSGGITTVANYVEGDLEKSLLDNYRDWKYRRSQSAMVDFALTPVIYGRYIDEVLQDMGELVEEGVSGLKLFMSGELSVRDVDLYRVIKKAAEHHVLCHIHCENGEVIDYIVQEWIDKGYTDVINHGYTRPACLEAEATYRVIAIAESIRAPIRIVHISSSDALNVVENAKAHGLKVLGETCPHYLTKDIGQLDLPNFEGAKNICSPPLREKQHLKALWEGLRTGSLTTIGSDHAPIRFEGSGNSKQLGRNLWRDIPNGCPGVGELFYVIYQYGVVTGKLTLNEFVRLTSYNAAKEFGLYPKKGCISVGSDADLVLWDPGKSHTLTFREQYGAADYNSYEGLRIDGQITHVFVRGEEVVRNGEVLAKSGCGRFVPQNPSSVFCDTKSQIQII